MGHEKFCKKVSNFLFQNSLDVRKKDKFLKKIKRDMKSGTQKMKKQEKKQGRSFFDPKLAAVKTEPQNLFKVIHRSHSKIQ